jgi:hypothetical protein
VKRWIILTRAIRKLSVGLRNAKCFLINENANKNFSFNLPFKNLKRLKKYVLELLFDVKFSQIQVTWKKENFFGCCLPLHFS